jgi:hypothetical protein
MSLFNASPAFDAAWMRAAFLTHCDDFALAWSVWCMGGEL